MEIDMFEMLFKILIVVNSGTVLSLFVYLSWQCLTICNPSKPSRLSIHGILENTNGLAFSSLGDSSQT